MREFKISLFVSRFPLSVAAAATAAAAPTKYVYVRSLSAAATASERLINWRKYLVWMQKTFFYNSLRNCFSWVFTVTEIGLLTYCSTSKIMAAKSVALSLLSARQTHGIGHLRWPPHGNNLVFYIALFLFLKLLFSLEFFRMPATRFSFVLLRLVHSVFYDQNTFLICHRIAPNFYGKR